MDTICFASHNPIRTTSFSRVCRTLAATAVSAGHDISVVGSDTAADSEQPAGPFDTAILVPPRDLASAAVRFARQTSAKLLVTIGDPWMFDSLAAPPCPWLACFPMDGGPVPREWTGWMRSADRLAVFSRFAQRLVEQAIGVSPAFLPHGVDVNVFAPADKADAKRKLIGDDRAFIVGCVATNALRKNLPALLRAFARFAADKPDALLYLHTPIVGYWDLEELTDRYGITSRTRATLNYDPHSGVPDATLATIYNAMDVLALPTMGEGFGLPLLEAAACGVPTIATDCSSCPELLPDPVQRVAVAATITMTRGVEQAIVDEADLAAKLNLLYSDAALRRRLATQGRAMAETMTWSAIEPRFLELL